MFDSHFVAWPQVGRALVVAELAPRWCSFVALAPDDESGRRFLGQALVELRELGVPGVVPPGWRSATEAEVEAFVMLAEDAEAEAFHAEAHVALAEAWGGLANV